ncbi:MAG: hypothetical protein D3920_14075, partial [Candidatus Electrothrix sp. AW2]|nr:hypothetical protein [Candidatus Electrothrix gigas]
MKTKGELYQRRERRELRKSGVLTKIGTALTVVFLTCILVGCGSTKAEGDPQSMLTSPHPVYSGYTAPQAR